MPAVEIEKLSTQVRLVTEKFGNPQELLVALRALFEFYADRTFRTGFSQRSSALLPEYHLSQVIMGQLEKELGKFCAANPLASLELIDLLWKEPFKEPRVLASVLLGRIPPSHAEGVITRLLTWSRVLNESSLVETIVANGSLILRTQDPEKWLEVIQGWLASSNVLDKSLGVTSLLPLIQDRSFVNLPQIFDLLIPLLKNPEPGLMSAYQLIIEKLARRSPNETVYVLKQVIAASGDQNLWRLLRRCLPAFPEDARLSLRAALSGS